jgi:hypothetical protein
LLVFIAYRRAIATVTLEFGRQFGKVWRSSKLDHRALRSRYDFSARSAVKPMGRRFGVEFMSSRIAESMAAMASSLVMSFFSMRASSW